MKKLFLFLILLILVGCIKQPTCEQACKTEGYKEGECKKAPVIQDPCSAFNEITLWDYECKQKIPENIVGVSYMCCCKE